MTQNIYKFASPRLFSCGVELTLSKSSSRFGRPNMPKKRPRRKKQNNPSPRKQNRTYNTKPKIQTVRFVIRCLSSFPWWTSAQISQQWKTSWTRIKVNTVLLWNCISIGRSAGDSAAHSMPMASSVEIAMTEQAILLVCRHTINIFFSHVFTAVVDQLLDYSDPGLD